MSAEERIYKQLEDISTSIIKALEGLEKELAEYIKITDSRLGKLENKVQRLESLADVSSSGLIKTIEKSTSQDKTSELSHIATQPNPPPSEPISQTIEPIVTKPVLEPKPEPTPTPQPQMSTAIPKPVTSAVKMTEAPPMDSKIPPVPIPPSFKPVLQGEQENVPEAVVPQPKPTASTPEKSTISADLEEKKKKEADKDKDDLMSALKMIDSL